jgi:hypothetical protein
MTASPLEQALLDNGTIREWTRTGITFLERAVRLSVAGVANVFGA